jgi:hypothetical protein
MLIRHLPALVGLVLLVAAPVPAAELPDSPDGTVRAVAEGVAAGQPEIIWHALPASYQQDVTELTRLLAETVDPQLWDAAFATCRRAAATLALKKNIILASSTLQQAGANVEELDAGWDAGVAVLDAMCSSEISTVAGLETMDWERFLKTTGASIVERARTAGDDAESNPIDELRRTEIETVSIEGDMAIVRMTRPGEEPEDVTLVRIEGRWVPADLAEGWDDRMDRAREGMGSMTDEERMEMSTQGMMFLGMADGFLAQLESVETPEQFDQMLAAIVGPFLEGMQAPLGEDPQMMPPTE